jgi:type VI secretion system protein ImpF
VSQADYDVRVAPSLLDRLLDADHSASRDVTPSRAEAVRAYKRGVLRDLENLLNSRNPHADLPAGFVESWRSVVTYGLPDLSGFNTDSVSDQQRLRQVIEGAIRTFEPRLAAVTTTLLPAPRPERTLRLRIDAKLLIEPTPEAISFDVVMPLQSAGCEVKETA